MGKRFRLFIFWCLIVNAAVLLFSWAGVMFAPDLTYDLQVQWFDVSKETVNIAMYAFLGLYKLFWIFFNVVPYIALRIVGTD